MNIIQTIILSIIQGLTEFIPVSSSGHLVIIPEVLNWESQSTAFDVILHAGTLFSLIFYFRKKIAKIAVGTIKREESNTRLFKLLVISSIPASVVALLIELVNKLSDDRLDSLLKNNFLVVFMLITVGFVFLVIEKYYKNNKNQITDLTMRNALIIGVGQILSLIRGTSRSGATIIFGISQNLTRKEAAEYSFLIGIPIISIAFIYELFKIVTDSTIDINLDLALIGFVVSFITGLLAISFMLKFLKNNDLKIFGYYRIILGLIVLITLLT